jgi:hypothetical protein
MANVTSVNVRSGHARSRRPRAREGASPSCLKTAVDITSFVICWVGPPQRAHVAGVVGSFVHAAVLFSPPDKWSGAIGFSMPVGLAPGSLYDRSFLPWRFNGNLHVT